MVYSWNQEEATLEEDDRHFPKSGRVYPKNCFDFYCNGEKFYPTFYNVFLTEPMFPRLGHLESRMLDREVAYLFDSDCNHCRLDFFNQQ